MAAALASFRAAGVARVVFGDLFLADIRAYREAQMAALGMEAVFPLWNRPTDGLAREMIAAGLSARLVAVDTARLDASFAGRAFDAALLADLPRDVDPCGERGEFHTAVTAGPMFRNPLRVKAGPVIRDGAFARVALSLS
jgi:diphthamide synthase (EF-2-diphthine--ammonia ligase)